MTECNNLSNRTYMAGFSQPQHFFAAARLFWVFGSMHASIGSSCIFMGSRIFLFEVLRRSDFQRKKCLGHFGGRIDSQTYKTPQNRQNSSTLGHDHTVKNNCRIILLDTIEEPMARGFQNTPYSNQNDNFSTFGVKDSKIFNIG